MTLFYNSECGCYTPTQWKMTLKNLATSPDWCSGFEGYTVTVTWNSSTSRWEYTGANGCTSWLSCTTPPGHARIWQGRVMAKVGGQCICILGGQASDDTMHCQNGGYLTAMECSCEDVSPEGNSRIDVEPMPAPGERYFVYLTFDDGPLPGTDDCIAVLNDSNVKGTFFMVGAHMFSDWRRQQVRSAYQSGHLVGNHSYSHWATAVHYEDPPTGKTNAEWLQDFRDCDAEMAEILELPSGTKFEHARLPGKNAWRVGQIDRDDGNSKRVADYIASKGYKIYGWDDEWHYTGSCPNRQPVETPEEMADRVKSKLLGGNTTLPGKLILLMHDDMFRESQGNKVKLEQFIDRLKEILPEVEFRRVDTYTTD